MKVIDYLNSMKCGSIKVVDKVNTCVYDDIDIYDRSTRKVRRFFKTLCNRKVSSISCVDDTLYLSLED